MLQIPYYLSDWEVEEPFPYEDPQPHDICGDVELFSDYNGLAASFTNYDVIARNDGQTGLWASGVESLNAVLNTDYQDPYYAELQSYTELSKWYSSLDFALTTASTNTSYYPPQLASPRPSGYPEVYYPEETSTPISQEFNPVSHSYTTPVSWNFNGESYPPLLNRFDQVPLAPPSSQSGDSHSYYSNGDPLLPNVPTTVFIPPATPLGPSPVSSRCPTPALQWSNRSSPSSTDFQHLPYALTPPKSGLVSPSQDIHESSPYTPPTPTLEPPATDPHQNAASATLAIQPSTGPIRNSRREQNRATPLGRPKSRRTYHDSNRDGGSRGTESDIMTVFAELGKDKFFQLQDLNNGLYFHSTFECFWKGCGRIIRRDHYDPGSQGQEDFQNAFITHREVHVDSAQKVPEAEVQVSFTADQRPKSEESTGSKGKGKWKTWSWTCKWTHCSHGSTGYKSDLRRHYLTHVYGWSWYCTDCKALRARRGTCLSRHGHDTTPRTTQTHTGRRIDLLGGL